jgi:biotin carboxyl carrier protein
VRAAAEEFQIEVHEDGDAFTVAFGGKTHHVELAPVVPSSYTLIVDGVSHRLALQDRSASWTLSLDGAAHIVDVTRAGRTAGAGTARTAAGGGEVRAPMPGLLVSVQVSDGTAVAAGQPVAIMEAMKMQMELRAPRPGTVRRISVAAGQELASGQVLMAIE